ncbi:MAG: hypothetical protein BWY92_01837 [Firmicutes bacterium ADurb.BinA052]|nr:MAG: hypothetical protein BWY92_01837 [Firmicutes bacterium ADurb.BinA052]
MKDSTTLGVSMTRMSRASTLARAFAARASRPVAHTARGRAASVSRSLPSLIPLIALSMPQEHHTFVSGYFTHSPLEVAITVSTAEQPTPASITSAPLSRAASAICATASNTGPESPVTISATLGSNSSTWVGGISPAICAASSSR